LVGMCHWSPRVRIIKVSHSMRIVPAVLECYAGKMLLVQEGGQVRFLLDKRVGDAVTVVLTAGAFRSA
jgi:hypothetical protein